MAYSLGARCLTEFLGTLTAIYFGEAILANELLPKTKGHAVGFGWVALGFAFSFSFGIFFFTNVSAHLNPAFCLALWINGKIDGTAFVALSAAEFAGAFVGAILVWLLYMPHFKTVPEPSVDKDDNLVHPRDTLSTSALRISSSSAHVPDKVLQKKTFPSLMVRDAVYWVKEKIELPVYDEEYEELKIEEKVSQDEQAVPIQSKPKRLRRRRSIQVADLHERIQKHEADRAIQNILGLSGTFPASPVTQGPLAEHAHERPRRPTLARANSIQVADLRRLIQEAEEKGEDKIKLEKAAKLGYRLRIEPQDQKYQEKIEHPLAANEQERVRKLYEAAVEADKKAKLSIFATRPAIYSPWWNFYCEMAGTASLCTGALLLDDVGLIFPEQYRSIYNQAVFPFYVGFLIFVLVLGQGGPTGYAANPARDFGPRLAHYLLPIHGKGDSEWGYAWVPFFADFAGGAIGGILFYGLKRIRNLS